jgi:hypothetical protein
MPEEPIADPQALAAQEPQKDRTTEQFEKLTAHNSSLKEELEQVKAENEEIKKTYTNPVNQVPDANAFSHLDQKQVNDVFAGMIDAQGFLDGNKLSQSLNEMNQRAVQAEQRARNAEANQNTLRKDINEIREDKAKEKVYSKYPQLDPDNKEAFDPKMWRAVYNALAVKAKAGEMPTDKDYLNAADEVYGDFYADKDMTQKEELKKKEIVETKQQINAIKPVSSVQSGYYADSDEDNLMDQVRQGKRGALAEMLARRGQ